MKNPYENVLIITKLKIYKRESEKRQHVYPDNAYPGKSKLLNKNSTASMGNLHKSHWLLTLFMCFSKYDRLSKTVLSVKTETMHPTDAKELINNINKLKKQF